MILLVWLILFFMDEPGLIDSFGFTDEKDRDSIYIKVLLIEAIFSNTIAVFLNYLKLFISRKFEYEADEFAIQSIYG